jgi:hypothetical protein
MELESRLRRQQRVTAIALLLAAGSLGFAIWSRRNPPSELRFADPDEGVETVVDAWGVRSSGHASSAKLDDRGLTLASGNAAVGMPVYEASVNAMYGFRQRSPDDSVTLANGDIRADGKGGSANLTVAGPPQLAMSAGKLRAELLLDASGRAAFLSLAAPESEVYVMAHGETSELRIRAGSDSRTYGAK